jgi:tetratricopeptide (TPR) repeat protein
VAICRRLDGLPLAIELAAARTRLLQPAALLARLSEDLDALGQGPVDLPERQRTLRATVEWSIDLLDADARQVLADLSVFVDGWTLDAAADVTGLDELDALDQLDALAGQSLVEVHVGATEPRFRMLVSVREVAAGDRRDGVEERHARHYAAMVAEHDWPMEGQAAWADRVLVDEGNIRAAVRWLFDHDVTPLPHLFRVLWLFWQMRDRMPEGRAWIEDLRAHVDDLDERARAELLLTSAVTAVEVGDDERALATIDDLRRLRQEADDAYLEHAAALALSWILPLQDDFEGALEAAEAALAGFREQGQPFFAFAELTVGMVQIVLGDHPAARDALEEVVELGERMDNSWLSAAARGQLASLAVRSGRPDDVRRLLAPSAAPSGDTEESTLTMTFALVARAELALTQGDAARAATALGAADGLRRRKGLRAWPSTRRAEADLTERVTQELGPDAFRATFDAGAGQAQRAADLLL